ncbi:MarR family transcriptional regulator [Cohaesibacter sp. CAU 1516]|uniref:MarR family winged helix-turn-helix transcriptional regulator n=1 Tax=Cohaesibacter sp. CAU 1516 TaxID=2576038 RepID=UPI0010FCDE5E|nr:MarR family transcriptional regulator [Cohaesibacter sp. CAU 1516]TLP44123.1 MarR family transcriptional regulator [Cohaesibacter sp. CAU 1516]
MIHDLIDRLARLDAAGAWAGDLNPTQRSILSYLARANRFSRSPSHVADYLGSTRGTVSQSLKSLAEKGYVRELRSEHDRRAISFDVTPRGHETLRQSTRLQQAVTSMDQRTEQSLQNGLMTLLRESLALSEGRTFGLCKSCKYHEPREAGGYCKLLKIDLKEQECTQICFEQDYG